MVYEVWISCYGNNSVPPWIMDCATAAVAAPPLNKYTQAHTHKQTWGDSPDAFNRHQSPTTSRLLLLQPPSWRPRRGRFAKVCCFLHQPVCSHTRPDTSTTPQPTSRTRKSCRWNIRKYWTAQPVSKPKRRNSEFWKFRSCQTSQFRLKILLLLFRRGNCACVF